MTAKERIAIALSHKEPDRVPVCDAPWASTVDNWRKEGFLIDSDPADYFAYEMKWLFPDNTPRFPYRILEENSEYIVETNSYGETIKNFKNRSTTPHILKSPVKDRSDWNKVKDRLVVDSERGISYTSNMTFDDAVSLKKGMGVFKKNRLKNRYITPVFTVGFDLVQRYLGMERLLFAIIDDPEWVREMFHVNAEFVIKLYENMVNNGYSFDGIFLADDLGYKNGLLFSPMHYKGLLFEADKLICDYFHDQGLKVLLHSCGCVKELVPYFIEAGIDCLQPLEVKAGMDLVKLKRDFGDNISFMGGIDTRLYSSDDTDALENEIKYKFKAAKKNGGYIYHCDHSIPNIVSFSQYERVIDLVKRYGKY
jgi:uroporphyrinogen decarboxylase